MDLPDSTVPGLCRKHAITLLWLLPAVSARLRSNFAGCGTGVGWGWGVEGAVSIGPSATSTEFLYDFLESPEVIHVHTWDRAFHCYSWSTEKKL